MRQEAQNTWLAHVYVLNTFRNICFMDAAAIGFLCYGNLLIMLATWEVLCSEWAGKRHRVFYIRDYNRYERPCFPLY